MKFNIKYTGTESVDATVIDFTIVVKEEASSYEGAVSKGVETIEGVKKAFVENDLHDNLRTNSYRVRKEYSDVRKHYWEHPNGKVTPAETDGADGIKNMPGCKLVTRTEQEFKCYSSEHILTYQLDYDVNNLFKFMSVMSNRRDSCRYTFDFSIKSSERLEVETRVLSAAIAGASKLAKGVAGDLSLSDVSLTEVNVIEAMRGDIDYASNTDMNCESAAFKCLSRIGSATQQQFKDAFNPEKISVSKSVSCVFEIE